MTAEERQLSRPEWRVESPPLLLTRAQAAELCQVSEEILDQWSYEPGFPVIRRNGGHFVRIHRTALERWLEEYAIGRNPRPLYSDEPPTAPVRRRVRR
jgi:hypothetical protein